MGGENQGFNEERQKEGGSTFLDPMPATPKGKLWIVPWIACLILVAVVLVPVARNYWNAWRPGPPKAPTVRDVPQLILQMKDPLERLPAIMKLAELGPAAKDAVPALLEVMNDKEAHLERPMAVRALGRIGSVDQRTVPALCKALQDESLDVRVMAINALAEMGPQAKDALPALNKLKDDRESPLSAAAAEALQKIRGKEPKQ